MVREYRERVKNIILVVLIITSLIQVGILLTKQSNGFPTNILAAVFGRPNHPDMADDKVVRGKLFVPFRIMAVSSDGLGTDWMLGPQEELATTLWDSAKALLQRASASKPDDALPVSEWGEITTKKGFLVHFGYTLPPELSLWFLSVSDPSSKSFPAMQKAMIVPAEKDGAVHEVYIFNAQGVHRYEMRQPLDGFTTEAVSKVFSQLKESRYDRYRVTTFKELNMDETFASADPDVPLIEIKPRTRKYSRISQNIPALISAHRPEELKNVVLGSERDNYQTKEFEDNTIQFNNTDNIYRIYANGLLEYDYLPQNLNSSDRGQLDAALKKAYAMVQRILPLMEHQPELYLADVGTKESGYYEFAFDYRVSGFPVFTEVPSAGKDARPVSHAVVLKASEKRIFSCRWLLRSIALTGNEEAYNAEVFESLPDTGDTQDYEKLAIRDISVGYVVDGKLEGELDPMQVIRFADPNQPIYKIVMPPGKGD